MTAGNPNIKKRKKKKLGSYPYPTVIFSISMALFVMGLFSLLLIHADKLSTIVKEKFEIHVYLQNNLAETRLITLQKLLSEQPYIQKKENTPLIHYISQEEAAEKFIAETGEDFSKILGNNPLHPSFSIRIHPDYTEAESLKSIESEILEMDGVFEVEYKENLITQINKNVRNISAILLCFSFILVLSSVLLINNTIKLALYSQRFLIRSMQLVGARMGFIRWPFLKHALLHGLISGMVAVLMLSTLLYIAYKEIPDMQILRDNYLILAVYGKLLVIGMLIGFFSTLRSINKYLNMSLDELY
ncbi:permease-like cell division protein FtsX [Cytophagaceae bacterium ABcell3]|nr:permease-like cell division protein FtsX [Cytophagaceae bacterium ABcell3]